jgi:hypothetical protein
VSYVRRRRRDRIIHIRVSQETYEEWHSILYRHYLANGKNAEDMLNDMIQLLKERLRMGGVIF